MMHFAAGVVQSKNGPFAAKVTYGSFYSFGSSASTTFDVLSPPDEPKRPSAVETIKATVQPMAKNTIVKSNGVQRRRGV